MKVKISFEIELPVVADVQQVNAWVKYQLGKTGEISGNNPLVDLAFDDTEISELYVGVPNE